MGCSGCKKAREAMKAQMQSVQTQSKIVSPKPIKTVVQNVQKTRRQLRAEARAIRIAARNAAFLAKNKALAELQKKQSK